MTKQELENKVMDIVADKLSVKREEVSPEKSFTDDLGADSLDSVELIMEFEKNFNIGIPDEVAENIKTVAQAIKCVEDRVVITEA